LHDCIKVFALIFIKLLVCFFKNFRCTKTSPLPDSILVRIHFPFLVD
jgi:hypothetical protein